jgi:hypothetical protein
MTRDAWVALLHCELRLRSRSSGSLVVLLAVLALGWLMVPDPAAGTALLVVGTQRLRYGSAALAFGSASLGSVLFSLAGFYLVRGRIQEDLHSGFASVLAASPVGNAELLLARWLGGLLFLLLLGLALMLSTWLLQVWRGEGPWQTWIYLQTYGLMLLPGLMLAAAMATLCDAWAPLMGRRGDVAYFVLWVALLALVPLSLQGHGGPAPAGWLWLDVQGIGSGIDRLTRLLGSADISVGAATFDAARTPRDFPADFWTQDMVLQRLASCLPTVPLLGLAVWAFHRCDPARVRARMARRGAGRLGLWLQRPLRRVAGLLAGGFAPLGSLPAPLAATAAEMLHTGITQPWSLLWLAAAWAVPLLPSAPDSSLVLPLLGWGLLMSELGTRGAADGSAAGIAALPGGSALRLASRWAAGWLLGLLALATQPGQFTGWLLPVLALLSALALALGQWTKSGRAFLALFLFGGFVAMQVGAR